MNLYLNKEQIKKIASISVALILVTTPLTGCKNTSFKESPSPSPTPSTTIEDSKNNYFVSYKNLNASHWYVIKYTDGQMQMTRMTTLDNLGIDKKRYYYVDAFEGGEVLGKVLYVREEKKYWVIEGKEIESAVSVADYIATHKEFYQENYTEENLKSIGATIMEDYEKKIADKDKVLIKKNSLY